MERILIVDDDHETRVVLEEILTRSGFAVSVAMGGSEAVRCWRTERIDLAIIDVWMPEKDGLETIMEIRRITSNAKIIAISGGGQRAKRDYLSSAKLMGVDATFQKPFDIEALLDMLHRLEIEGNATTPPPSSRASG